MMKLTSSCTETSTRSVPAHVCTTDGFTEEDDDDDDDGDEQCELGWRYGI